MLMTILLGNLTATMLFAPVSSSLVAYERFILIRLLEIGSSILSTVAIVLVLYLGHKVVAVVIVTAVVNLMVLAIKVGYAFLVLKVRLKVEKPELAFLKEIVKFSSAIFIVVVVEQIYWKLDNIFLGAMLGTSAVAVFSIGMSFNKYFMSFGTAISKVMMPKIVRRVEHGADGTELTNLLTSISRIQAVVLLPILTGLIMFGREFIDLWMGPDFQLAYFVMLATMVPFSLELVGNVRNQIMQAKDIYWYRSATVLFMSMIKIALTLVLIPILGMMGAAVSTGLGLLLGYLAVNYILKVKVGIDTWRYSRELAAGLIPAAAASAVVAFLLNLIPGSSWGILSVKIAIYGLAYILAAWYIGMNPYERQLIADLSPRNRKRVAAEGA
jgi:O-antigen/teichoic acid export membrane protein